MEKSGQPRKWIFTAVISLALGVGAFLFVRSIKPQPADQTHTNSAQIATDAAPIEPASMVTVTEVEKSPSHAKLQTYLATLDAAGLTRFIDGLNTLDVRTPWQAAMREQAFHLLVEKRSAGALARLEATFEKNDRGNALQNLFASLAKRDITAARELLELVEDEKLRKRAEKTIAIAWLQKDRTAALAWFKEIRGEEAFDKEWRELIKGWSRQDPHAALREIEASDRDEGGQIKNTLHGALRMDCTRCREGHRLAGGRFRQR